MDKKLTLDLPREQPLPGFRIQRLLGQGGLGEVYFGTTTAGKEVALKLFTDLRGVQGRGARTILNLTHPNLVHLYNLVTDDKGREWLVMEYVQGESLDKLLARPPRQLSLTDARSYFADMAGAVEYLHEHDIMHRDLKPANLLLPRGTHRLKVVDFDLCRPLAGDLALTRKIGTPEYMAPEMHTGSYDHRVDIYASGLILAEMLTGAPVFGDQSRSIIMQHQLEEPNLSKIPSERLRRVIARSLEKDKEKRYSTMAQMAAEVDAAFAELVESRPIPLVNVAPPIPVARPVDTVPFARPVPVTGSRHIAAGVVGGMLAAPVVISAIVIPLWFFMAGKDTLLLLRLILTTTAISWAVLLGGLGIKLRERLRLDRRFLLGILGLGVGALTYWMDGWPTPKLAQSGLAGPAESYLFGLIRVPMGTFQIEISYLFYFGLALLAPRWWRCSALDRESRFSLQPPLEATAWAAMLLIFWPWAGGSAWQGILPLALSAVAIQIVSPWVPTVAVRVPRKRRLPSVA